MENNNSRLFFKWFLGSMFLFYAIFYILAASINVFYYHMPLLNPLDDYKYIIFSTLSALHLDFTFGVELPDALFPYMQAAGWTGSHTVQAVGYPKFYDVLLPNSWIYKALLYWLWASAAVSVFFSCYKLTQQDTEKIKKQTRIRGAEKATAKELYRSMKKDNGNLGISIGNLHLPIDVETRHFLILGTTGTGKSYLLMKIISEFKRRSVRMIVLDRKGEFYSAFANPATDIYFHPYDRKHVNWSIYNEFSFSHFFDHIPEQLRDLADSLFSVSSSNKNVHFYNAAADVFCSGLCYLAMNGKITNADIKDFFTAGGSQIVAKLKTLPAGLKDGLTHLGEDGTDEHSGSILSTLSERTKDFSAFIGKDGDFSIRNWVEKGNGNLYISTAGPNDERYKSIVTMLLDIVGSEVKSFPEKSTTKLVIVIDELASLPPLKTLDFLLNEGRSKGICVILANQTFSKIREIYGEARAKNIFGNTNTKFVFRLPEPSDSEYVSKAMGDQEVQRVVKSKNETNRNIFASGGDSKGITTSEQIAKEAIFLPAQIQNLQKRHAIAMIPSFPIAEIELPTLSFPMHYQCYEPAETNEISAKDIAAIMKNKKLATESIDKTNIPAQQISAENPEENFLKS